ncbi:GNAT family N-acetyltransferase [Kitasatospora sp. NPDC051170]|uniref:GNAT family N-acetyltransferase n=1 Tax=Kitasatospora sp. NPDC051170 TaxID=3364056 RepID=UPI00378D495B
MTPLTIREFRPEDAEAAYAAHRTGREHLVTTPEALVWRNAREQPGAYFRTFVAELDGQVVASVRCAVTTGTTRTGVGHAGGSVLPAFRRRGVFTALLAQAERHLAAHGVTELQCWVDDDPGSLAFAAARGFRLGSAAQFSGLDLTLPLPPAPETPAGVELRPATEWAEDPYPLYLIDAEASRDEPGEAALDDLGYDEWRGDAWDRPDIDHALTIVAVVDGEPAAMALVQTDGRGAYWSAFTACRREFRGRGLSKLAKRESLRRAVEAGCRRAYTSNDVTNAPMLAINRWLGYERCAGERMGLKTLG